MTFQPRLSALLAATAATAFAPALFAQDDCATATPVTDGMTAFDNTTALDEGAAFGCGSGAAFDLWFSYTAVTDGMGTFELCGSTFDTRMEIYDDCAGAALSCNDDSCGLQSSISLSLVGGTTYFIRAAGWNGATGAGTLTVDGPTIPDECVDANTVPFDLPTDFDTTIATPSAEPWSATGNTPNDVWFTFTPTSDYMADISTCNMADYDTRIELYSGACGALVVEATNDDGTGCAGFSSLISGHPVLTGVQYFVRVGGFGNTSNGTGQLLVTGPPPAVANDECIGAIDLANGAAEMFDNTMATNSASAPAWSCGGTSANALDIWYTFTPLADSSVTVDTEGSSFDTRLEVYEGDCAALVSIACDDDGGTGTLSSVTFAGIGGTTYYARVAGFSGGSGMGQVTATFADSLPNDDCAGAEAVGLGVSMGTNVGATDSGVVMDCSSTGGNNDVWFSFTAVSDCPVTIDLSGSDYDTVLEVFDGNDCNALTSLACDDDGGTGLDSLATFPATAGTTYLFHVGGFGTGSGNILMTITECGSTICAGEPNSTGVGAVLSAAGSNVVADNALVLNVDSLPLNSMGFIVHSAEENFVANPGGSVGNLCIASFDMGRFDGDVLDSGATGSVTLMPDLTAFPSVAGPFAVMAGETRNFQHWYRDVDAGGAPVSNFSSAIGVTFE